MELFRTPPPAALFSNPSAFVAALQQSSPPAQLPLFPSPSDIAVSSSPIAANASPTLPLFLSFPSTSTTTSILMDTVLAAQKLNQQNSMSFIIPKQEVIRSSPPISVKMKTEWSPKFFPSSQTTTTTANLNTWSTPLTTLSPLNVPSSTSTFFGAGNTATSSVVSVHHPVALHPDDTKTRSEVEQNGGVRKGERCVGCGSDSAIRVHYGASSCHGCKAFFRRSVFEGRVYMCSAESNCDITNESRNRCRACRLRNCLDGGMNPKHVREERSKIERVAPGSTTCTVSAANGVTHNPTTSSGSTPTSSNSFPASVEAMIPCSETESVDRKTTQEHSITLFMCALEKQTEQLTDDDVKDNDVMGAWSRDISLTFGLQHPQMVIKRLPLMYTCERIMEASDLYLSWYRSFVFCADWAMGIPEFRVLPLSDQTTLFKQNFMAFGWITFAFKCFQKKQHTTGIPLGNGAFIPYNDEEQKKLPERWAVTYGVVCKKLIDLIVKVMIELDLSEEEYCLIKTISLFQQDCILSDSGAATCSKMRDRLLDALSAHIEKRFPDYTQSQKTTRALKISLMLPSFSHIGQVESTLIQQLTAADLHQLSGVPMEICTAQQTI